MTQNNKGSNLDRPRTTVVSDSSLSLPIDNLKQSTSVDSDLVQSHTSKINFGNVASLKSDFSDNFDEPSQLVQKKKSVKKVEEVLSMNTTGLYFSIKIGELSLDTFDVVEFNLDEALSELFTLTLSLSSRNANIDLQEQLLQKAQLIVYSDGQKQRIINGIVEKAECGDSGFKRTYYTFVVRPLLWLLTLTKDSRIYHFKTVPEIIDEILQDFNIVFDKQLMDAHSVREYTTMKRESYYQFVSRLAAEEGIIFWFEESKMFYSDSHLGMTGGLELLYNSHPQPATKELVINKLRFACTMRPTEAKVKDYRYSHPDVKMDAKSQAVKELPIFEVYDSYGRYENEQIAQQFSKYRLEALQSDSELGRAFSNSIQLMPGKIFQVREHPSKAMNDRWQVVRITHRGTLPQSLDNESDDSSAMLTNDFSFIPGKNDWRSAFIHKPQADGDEIATVVGPAGEEIYVNEDGAVKVHFHWNRYDQPDGNASCWVRVMQNWNGDGFGFLATPRIGQEVIISYLNGDIDRPIITGTVYNGNNRPPIKLPENKTQMSIRSKTHKGDGFNELRFEDDNGKEEVFIHAQKDMNIKILNNETEEIGNDHTEVIGNNQTQHIKNDHSIKIDNNHFFRTQSSSHITVDGEQRNHIKSNHSTLIQGESNLKIESNYQTEVGSEYHLKSGQNIVINSGATITLNSAGSFVQISPGGIILSGPSVQIISGGGGSVAKGFAGQLPLLPTELNLDKKALQAAAIEEKSNDITLHLETVDGYKIPYTRYFVKFKNGEIRQGMLDEEGKVTLVGVPENMEYLHEYPDVDDILAKANAQRLNKAIKQVNSDNIIGYISLSSTLVKNTAHAYYQIYHRNLVSDIYQALGPYHKDKDVIDYLLYKAELMQSSDENEE